MTGNPPPPRELLQSSTENSPGKISPPSFSANLQFTIPTKYEKGLARLHKVLNSPPPPPRPPACLLRNLTASLWLHFCKSLKSLPPWSSSPSGALLLQSLSITPRIIYFQDQLFVPAAISLLRLTYNFSCANWMAALQMTERSRLDDGRCSLTHSMKRKDN